MGTSLSIDTSTSFGSVCISRNGNFYYVEREGFDSHSKYLHEIFLEAVAVSKCSLNEIENIFISEGPGSFTGLRIGYSFAKGLSQVLSVPLTSVPTLAAYSLVTSSESIILSDARSDLVYSGIFKEGISLDNKDTNLRSMKDCSDWIKSCLQKYPALQLIIAPGSEELVKRLDVTTLNIFEKQLPTARLILEHGLKMKMTSYSLLNLANSGPRYVRGIAAKTIKERLTKGAI